MDKSAITDSIFSIMTAYRLAMRSTLKANEIGLNAMHVKCLTFINKSRQCTANDIVNYFGRDKAQVARLIKEMIDNQWLTKSANPDDKRSQILSLTKEGIALAELISSTQNEVHQHMQQHLSAVEIAAFVSTAEVILANLQTYKAAN
ncbi:MarR family winged helix-turn-helix transcriptional regulator [Shewanella aestuarii]|uniref:MarR family transcriptional regulator n=1 Tax=Shewanella aestuarii TaxID=1028752 RepID=A0A6G9QP57_9GAMM|nr:MarR family transcriptional regulator [Shewanella aestuarii]QIR15619.1 MarR family transcriptional regulator [Shewanella aestuarii]